MTKSTMLLVLLAALAVHADDLEVMIHGTAESDDSLGTLSVMVSVIDMQGNGIAGLDSTNFRITCCDDSLPLLPSVTLPERGIGLVMCVDVSGTMQEALVNVKSSLADYLDSLRTQDRVAVFTFADSVSRETEFSNNSSYLKSIIQGMSTYGSRTALYEGVRQGLEYFRTSSPEDIDERYLLVFSDGKNDDSIHPVTLDDCTDLANDLGIPVISVGLLVQREDCVDYITFLQQMSDATGGTFRLASTAEQLDEAFRKTLSITRNRYMITFTPPDSLDDGTPREYTIHASWNGQTGDSSFHATTGTFVDDGGSQAMIILIVCGAAILIGSVIHALQKRRTRKKLSLLNSELKRSRDRIEHLEQEIITGEDQGPDSAHREVFEEDHGRSGTFEPLLPRKLPADRKSPPEQPSKPPRPMNTMIDTGGEVYSKGELSVLNGPEAGRAFDVTRTETTIGKSPDCTIVLTEEHVSRTHATVRFLEQQFHVVDHDSTNGTFVNGNRVMHSHLKDGDVIRLGKVELRFRGGK